MKFRNDIQGFRALAVIMVIIFHINKDWLPGGFVGVDVFFVISGYLISGIIIKQTQQGTFNYYHFMVNRLKRIAPAYFVMLLSCLLVSSIILTHLDFETFLYQLRRTYIFISNMMFATGSDYFGSKTHENSLLHTWSLSIEMQFYLFLPLLFLLPRKIYKWLLLGIGILLVFYSEYQLQVLDNKQAMYFSLLARVPEFLLGAAVHFVTPKRKIPMGMSEGLGIVGLLLILVSAFFISESSLFPGVLSLPVCLGTAILLYNSESMINRFFGLLAPVYIGELSYSLYLFHWPVLALARYHYGRYELTATEIIMLLPVIIGLSMLSYYFVEQKLRHFSNRKIIFALGGITGLMVFLWVMFFNTNQKTLTADRPYVSNSNFDASNHAQYSGYKLKGDISRADDHILLLGDSHGFVMTAFFEEVGKKNGFNFSSVTTDSVPPLAGIPEDEILPEYRPEYRAGTEVSNRLIPQADIIFIVKHWYDENPVMIKNMVKELKKKMRPDQHLVIVSDFPAVEKHPYRQYRSVVKPVDFKRVPVRFPKTPAGLSEIAEKNSNVHILDLSDRAFFAEAPYYRDTLMYYDESHLNLYGSKAYAKHVGNRLAALVHNIKRKNGGD